MSFISFKLYLIIKILINLFHLFFICHASLSSSSYIAAKWISLGPTVILLIFSLKLLPHHSSDGFQPCRQFLPHGLATYAAHWNQPLRPRQAL